MKKVIRNKKPTFMNNLNHLNFCATTRSSTTAMDREGEGAFRDGCRVACVVEADRSDD
jgi:hypothetical protein